MRGWSDILEYSYQCLPQIIIQSDDWNFQIFSRSLEFSNLKFVHAGHLFMNTVFTIKFIGDLKSKYKV